MKPKGQSASMKVKASVPLHRIFASTRLFLHEAALGAISKRESFIFWGHLGLGDQISMAILYEKWQEIGFTVYVPCKSRNWPNLVAMFKYLPNIYWVPIDDNPRKEASEVRRISKIYGLTVLNAGRLVFDAVRLRNPNLTVNSSLLLAAGLEAKNVYSERFRVNVLELPQIQPPPQEFAFENWLTSMGSFRPQRFNVDDLPIEFPDQNRPIYEHALLIERATRLTFPGSAFMCLALVMGSSAKRKIQVVPKRLTNVVPEIGWELVIAD